MAVLLCLGACAGPRAVERVDANSRAAHAGLLQKARTGHIDLYFLGDSITRRWGGDTTANILWRIRHGELDGVHPKVIVLLAGTNDLGSALQHHADPDRTVSCATSISTHG